MSGRVPVKRPKASKRSRHTKNDQSEETTYHVSAGDESGSVHLTVKSKMGSFTYVIPRSPIEV